METQEIYRDVILILNHEDDQQNQQQYRADGEGSDNSCVGPTRGFSTF